MDVPLRIRDGDAGFPECIGYLEPKLAGREQHVVGLADEKPELEDQRAVPEFPEDHRGRRGVQYIVPALGAAGQHAANELGIRIIGYAHRHDDPCHGAFMGPVQDFRGHELAVGDDHFGIVESLDLRRHDVDFLDIALVLADHDPVTGLDGPVHQQDQPRYEVVHDMLKAEADADGQGTEYDRELAELQAQA